MTIPDDVDNLILLIPRVAVETYDLNYTLSLLNNFIVDIPTIQRLKSQISIGFDGYDNDPREIFEIEEIRKYAQGLTQAFPYWFYFLKIHDDNLRLILLLLCRYCKVSPGKTELQPDDYINVMTYLFASLNTFFNHYNLPEHENDLLSQEISDYLAR